ncbi:MAG: leucine-rich repeat protein [Oscillospiraceae bacterium]|nr:leucine-rich repeat protein [Oscillospiraceae bacterium]
MRIIKNFLCLVLAVSLVFSFGISAFALGISLEETVLQKEKSFAKNGPEPGYTEENPAVGADAKIFAEESETIKPVFSAEGLSSAGKNEFDKIINVSDPGDTIIVNEMHGIFLYIALASDFELSELTVCYFGDSIISAGEITSFPEEWGEWEEINANYVYYIGIEVSENYSANYISGEFWFEYDGEKTQTYTLINDAVVVDEDDFAAVAGNNYYYLGGEGYSDYYYRTAGEKVIYERGAYSVSEEAFEKTAGKEVAIATDFGQVRIYFHSVQNGQKGINFYSYFSEIGETEKCFCLKFFDKTPILGTCRIDFASGYTFGNIRDFFGVEKELEKRSYYIFKEKVIHKEVVVDYSVLVGENEGTLDVPFSFPADIKDEPLGSFFVTTAETGDHNPGTLAFAGGYCGEPGNEKNVEWLVTSDGKLTISGTGRMDDYATSYPRAWYDFKEIITELEITEGVTNINRIGFSDYDIEKITLAESVREIPANIFRELGIKTAGPIGGGFDYEFGWKEEIPANAFRGLFEFESVEIPESVRSIGNWAFANCRGMKEISLPKELSHLGADIFYHCSMLESIVIPERITEIKEFLFVYCENLKNVSLPEGITSMGNGAFYDCVSLENINMPEKLEYIGESVFHNCASLEKVDFSENVTYIDEEAFGYCSSLKEFTFPEKVKIATAAVVYCCENLEKINLPENLEIIEFQAFYNCPKLAKITIPENVAEIHYAAFMKCPLLEKIYFKGNAPEVYAADYVYPSFDPEVATLYYLEDKEGWESPLWNGYKTGVWKNSFAYGDINGDGKVNVLDANLVRRCSAKLLDFDENQLAAADVDGNGKVNVLDANLIRRYSAKLIGSFPAEE